MRITFCLWFAVVALIFVRATIGNAYSMPIWSPMWWVWIFATVAVAACAGGSTAIEWMKRTGRLAYGRR